MKTLRLDGRALLAALTCWLAASASFAQGPVPVEGDLQVNTYTRGAQLRPEVATLAGGGLVAVWQSSGSDGTDPGNSVQGRLFAPDGTIVGAEFQLNTYVDSVQDAPQVAALPGGGFVAVWASLGSSGTDSSSSSVQGQRFADDGTRLGGEFQVNTYVDDGQSQPAVAGLNDGGFVVVWSSRGSSGTDASDRSIQGQRFDGDGAPVGDEFQINTYTTGSQQVPAVTALGDGGFEVVWAGENPDFLNWDIFGRRYAGDGAPAGDEYQVNTYTTGYQLWPAVATLTGGDTVVTWASDGSGATDSDQTSIQGQRFAPDGSRLGGEFQVNTYTAHNQRYPAVSASADGGFVAVWVTAELVGIGNARETIQGQRFAPDGSYSGGEFQVSSGVVFGQGFPSVAPLDDGGLFVAWESLVSSGTDSDWYSVQSRRFAAPRFSLTGLGGKCLDIEAADPSDGTPVNLYRCHGGANQLWQLELTAIAQRIRGLEGKCLLPGAEDGAGNIPAVIGPCGGESDLWWRPVTGHAEESVLVHVESGLCLDVAGGSAADGTPIQLFSCHGGANQRWRPTAEVCTADSGGLCLESERFRAEVEWRSFDGTTGSAKAVPVGSDDSGLLWFFEADNWEMLIKVLDGCAHNDRFWVFAAATTTVETTLRITDTATGSVAEYFNPLGTASAAITDTDAFATCGVGSGSATAGPSAVESPATRRVIRARVGEAKKHPTGCEESAGVMCLSESRFSVEVDWRDYEGDTGFGTVVGASSDDSGLFWFFEAGNWEMLVKVLDACESSGRYWLLAAATTDVEYTLRVTDLASDETRVYFNPLGTAAPALIDTFETCP